MSNLITLKLKPEDVTVQMSWRQRPKSKFIKEISFKDIPKLEVRKNMLVQRTNSSLIIIRSIE